MRRERKRWMAALRLLVSAVLVIAVVAKVGPSRVLRASRGGEPHRLMLALALVVPRFAAKVVRWKAMTRRAARPSWALALRSLLVGTAAAAVTPGRVGQASASLLFPPGSRMAVSALALLEPAADLVATLWMAILVAGGVPAAAASAVAGLVLARVVLRAGGKLSRHAGIMSVVGRALSALDTATVLRVAILSVVIYGFNLVQFHLLLNAHQSVPWETSFASLPFIFLAVAIPVTISGLGVREVASVLVLGRHGVDEAVAVRASFELFVLNVGLPGLMGALVAAGGRASVQESARDHRGT